MDKITERYIKLTNLLYSYNEFVSLAELAKAMELSSKTTKIDLMNISEYLKSNNYGLFLTTQGSNYYLERESINYLNKLILNIKKESIYFFITDHLFYNKLNLKEKFNENFYSVSYFYKSKINYKNKLKEYGINLSRSPTQLIGDEEVIRFYFYSFYWENFGKVEWPFSHIKKAQTLKIIQEIEHTIQISFTKMEQLKLSYWIAVITCRTRNQKFMNDSFDVENLNYIECKKDFDWTKILFMKNKIIDCQTGELESKFLLSILLLILDTENWERLVNEKKMIYKTGDLLDCSIKFCESIQNTFQLKKDMNSKVILYEVYRVLSKEIILNGNLNNQDNFYARKEIVLSLFNEAYQKSISELAGATVGLWKYYKKKPGILGELMYIILNSVNMKVYQPITKVYLYLSKGKLEEIIVMEQLSQLQYNIIFAQELNSSVNLIITDVYLLKKDNQTQCFFWNDTSIENNISCFKCFINKFTDKRRLHVL